MRRRHSSPAVELTPLLDVILILLFVVLIQYRTAARNSIEAAEEERAAAAALYESTREENEALWEENAALEARAVARDGYGRYARVVSVTVAYREDGERLVILSDGEREEGVSYGWSSLRYGENAVRDAARRLIAEDGPTVLLLSYRPQEIYNADYELLTAALQSLAGEDIYLRVEENID